MTSTPLSRPHLDDAGLPAFDYTGPLPCRPEGIAPDAPCEYDDPFSLVGNHGLTLFVHASGAYQLLSCERGFARLNHDGSPSAVGHACHASLAIGSAPPVTLLGKHAPAAQAAKKTFGVGRASFAYELPGSLLAERILSTVPSRDATDRVSGFRITLRLRNAGAAPLSLAYEEGLDARYHFANWDNPPRGRRLARYPVEASVADDGRAVAVFRPESALDYVFSAEDDQAQADAFPPAVILAPVTPGLTASASPLHADGAALRALWRGVLAPGQSIELALLVGYEPAGLPWAEIAARLATLPEESARLWDARLPRFAGADPETAAELRWHAAMLHAMAVWDDFHRQTFIPQGTVYEYALGVSACTRDHAQHALPLCHYDPGLARSVLLYLAKHTNPRGSIRSGDEGLGYFPVGADQKSDNELYSLWLAAEYLGVTRDAAALEIVVPFDGMSRAGSDSLLDRLARWFRYFRDCVHTGPSGLVRLMCSDWNDCFYGFFKDVPYSRIFHQGESMLNTTLALHVLGSLADALDALPPDAGASAATLDEARRLARALRSTRASLLDAFLKDWGDADFPVRARIGRDLVVGDKELFLEPLGFILGLPEVPEERRHRLWDLIRERLMDREMLGARQRETPGSRENGGIWHALNGNLVTGLARLDRDAARDFAARMGLRQHRRHFPDQWVGQWSGGDSHDPSATRADTDDSSFSWDGGYGGPGNTAGRVAPYLYPFPVFCAHAHAWPLQAHFLLAQS